MSRSVEYDLNELSNRFSFKEELRKKTILVTGGTGLIGSLTIKFLCYLNKYFDLHINIYSTVRNSEKAYTIATNNEVNWLVGSLDDEIKLDYVDFIIHTACPTQSSYLSSHPVEVINDTITGARNIFELAKKSNAKVVYLSSIEVYGQFFEHKKLDECQHGYIDHLNPRSCYPQSKLLIESLAASYAFEYGVDIKTARLTQTFGSGIATTDNRVFAQFARSAIRGDNIVLHTEGRSSKNYLYTTDAINAIFYILINGERGEAYNVANDETYISIYDLAHFIRDTFNKNIEIITEIDKTKGYAPDTLIDLDTTKIKKLGWCPYVDLKEMFNRLIRYLNETPDEL